MPVSARWRATARAGARRRCRCPRCWSGCGTAGEEFACVLDEYGGLAGVITRRGHRRGAGRRDHRRARPGGRRTNRTQVDDGWTVPGIDAHRRGRAAGRPRPARGDYQTVGGLVITELRRLPEPGDTVTLTLPGAGADDATAALRPTVHAVDRRVPVDACTGRVDRTRARPPTTGHEARRSEDGRDGHEPASRSLVAVALIAAERVLRRRSSSRWSPPAATGWRRPPRPARPPARRCAARGTCRCCWPGPSWGSRCARSGLGAVAKPAVHDLLLPLLRLGAARRRPRTWSRSCWR